MSMYKKFLVPEEKPFSLNITSMTDMFTILLVFLLQTFTAQSVTLDIPQNLTSPSASLPQDVAQVPTIFVSKDNIQWDHSTLLTRAELQSSAKREQASAVLKDWTTKNPDKKIQLMADKGTSYAEIKMILSLAANAQIGEIKLVTLKGTTTASSP